MKLNQYSIWEGKGEVYHWSALVDSILFEKLCVVFIKLCYQKLALCWLIIVDCILFSCVLF